ncbi:MAG: hypothetical protein ACLPX5_02570 [Dissulfurispiraceae bacterium]
MSKHAGAYKSEKRKKELTRQKRQEEKRQKRIKGGTAKEDAEIKGSDGLAGETKD